MKDEKMIKKMTVKTRIEQDLFARVPYDMIVNLDKKMSVIQLTKKCTCAYYTVIVQVPKLVTLGLITADKVKLKKYVELTKAGHIVRQKMLEIGEVVNNAKV